MTDLLGTFFNWSAGPNQRGELDGAAWRFVLPGDVETIEWRRSAGPDERDLHTLARYATVITQPDRPGATGSSSRRVDLVVGAARSSDSTDAPPIGIDLDDDGSGHPLELRYEDDELRGVVPGADSVARSMLARHVGADGPVPRSWKQRLQREPVRIRRTVAGSLRGVRPGPPAWLVESAAEAGFDVSDFSWALWCRGEFGSQKLVMFLSAPGHTDPSIVVKITRDERFNDRLVNESNMLRAIAQLSAEAQGGAPSLLFHTTVWGSWACAESAVVGSGLGDHIASRPELIGRVTSWMVEMANATRTPIRDGELRACMGRLVDGYCDLYDVPPEAERFLRRQVDLLDESELHAVAQHGDPHVGNAVVTRQDAVAFLDWEAGESRGIPLWDLFYFMRSASLAVTSRPPWQSRRSRTRRDLIVGSEVGELVSAHVRSYVDATGLDPTVVEPLFHLCWVHRAVKEARRLPPGRRANGRSHRLVRDSITGRDQPGLRRLTMRTDMVSAR